MLRLLRRFFGLEPSLSDRTQEARASSQTRRWQLLQIETALACNLRCVMCPWKDLRDHTNNQALMSSEVWEAVRPHLSDIVSVDFTGGGEPLLQPMLVQWVAEAKSAGCETGILTNAVLLNQKKAKELISAGLDWLCVSIDGADKETYEQVRKGSDFEKVCDNLAQISNLRTGRIPKTMINFVIMSANAHQIEAIVALAAHLKVDHVNFKQCAVVREEHGKGLGVFQARESGAVRRLDKSLARSRRLAKRVGVAITASRFTPSERPVCEQDPCSSMFVRYDGAVAPCINCAYGGPTTFLGADVTMPTVHYGRLPESDLQDLWDSQVCRRYRECFEDRRRAYGNTFLASLANDSLRSHDALVATAARRMPAAPESCRVCHYLYGM